MLSSSARSLSSKEICLRRFSPALVLFGVLLPTVARAQESGANGPAAASASVEATAPPGLRLHGTLAAARALGGHQKDELGWGVAGLAAAEWAFVPELGVQLELGSVWLSEGEPPDDPTIEPQGAGSSAHLALGVRARPFASAYAGQPVSAAGIWLAAAGGAARTGGLTRPMFDVGAGYDFLFADGRFGIGPMVGYLHVFQPNDELRPADANVLLVGVHAMFDTAAKKRDGDRDGDGILDSVDRCPDDPEDKDGFEDADGCPERDNDRDGVLDPDDGCPMVPEDKDGFEDADGCPENDNDRDGLLDPVDKCPNDPEDKDGFEDDDGCPDKDNDQDGFLDPDDKCPLEPETKNGYADDDGCPDEQQVRVVGDEIILDDRIHFWTNSAKIRPVSYSLLERLAKVIRDNPTYKHISIQGHTDERGPEWFNEKLSEDRAQSVLEFLVDHGIERGRLSAEGFGSSRPLVDRKSERAWFMNRRVEFKVTREVEQVVQQGGPAAGPSPPGGESSKEGKP